MSKDEFSVIGENGTLLSRPLAGRCTCCDNAIPINETYMSIAHNGYSINTCKACIRLAAKRLGVLR